jgi:hypothetical protein
MIGSMAEAPLITLRRWEDSGAHWRLRWRTDAEAEVDLLTCLGEPVERLRSADPELLAYLARRSSSEEEE